MGKPNIPQIDVLLQAGIDPKTGLPLKVKDTKCTLKEDTKKFLRLIDEQDAVNRYVWKNLPNDITSQELERMLYYKGQLCFFYNKDLEEYYFMPYALDGTIDFYGRFNTIHPVPMTSGTDDKGSKAQAQLLSNIKLKCIYKVKDDIDTEKSAVLLHDYTKQLSQTIIPRVQVNDPILDTMAECLPFMRTSLINSTGVKGVRVNDADQADSVAAANKSMQTAALTGNQMVPIVGSIEFQELADGQTGKSEEYMSAMQSLDNLRLAGYGIDNGGLFERKSQYQNIDQTQVAGGPVGLILQDGLAIRQHFCDIVNQIWGLNITCEANSYMSEGIDTSIDEPDKPEAMADDMGGEDNE